MLDDFREWLSDNLRYFMLGGAILLVLLVIVFGVRACTKSRAKKPEKEQKQVQEEVTITPSAEEKEPEGEEETQNQLQKADADIEKLIKDYYTALGAKDVEALEALVEDLSPSDESQIINSADYIERYEVNAVYTKEGLDDKAYVVYADYAYYCQDFEPSVPALSQFYVREKSDGSFIIDGMADSDSTISAYTKSLQKQDDVKKLANKIKSANQETLEANPDLQEFLQGLGDEGSEDPENYEDTSSEQEHSGIYMIANDVCNVRANPGGEIIGGIDVGTRIEKLGELDGYIKFEYEGEIGYVYGELLDEE